MVWRSGEGGGQGSPNFDYVMFVFVFRCVRIPLHRQAGSRKQIAGGVAYMRLMYFMRCCCSIGLVFLVLL